VPLADCEAARGEGAEPAVLEEAEELWRRRWRLSLEVVLERLGMVVSWRLDADGVVVAECLFLGEGEVIVMLEAGVLGRWWESLRVIQSVNLSFGHCSQRQLTCLRKPHHLAHFPDPRSQVQCCCCASRP
jgi:hypothetical protein